VQIDELISFLYENISREPENLAIFFEQMTFADLINFN
jgi:hypothetical protein